MSDTGWSQEWDELYAAGEHANQWPFDDVRRLCGPLLPEFDEDKVFRILELGCGVANNEKFLDATGHLYYGVDGSASAFMPDPSRHFPYEEEGFNLAVSDFTREIPWPDVQSLAVFHKNGKRKELPSYQKGRSFQFRYVFLLHTQKFRLLGETFLINGINPQIVPK